ncbi:MAG: hypothetical protein KF767_07135 [Bdellovibrionaceae bacterium]|nr:hypothetical protein [Pseudobdellovibrionaceae bacterium]
MRRAFSDWTERVLPASTDCFFLTGDLGYNAFEGLQKALGERFLNAGVCEQHMVSMAAGMASFGYKTLCYSIAPFAIFRPMEQLRLDAGIHKQNVKVVGNGGGYGYGIMGATHHALEDLAVTTCLPHFRAYVPCCDEEVGIACDEMMRWEGPTYLRLGAFTAKGKLDTFTTYSAVQRRREGRALTVVVLGPLLGNAWEAVQNSGTDADLFSVSQLPLTDADITEIRASLSKTGKLLVLEEHVARGGLGEHLVYLLARGGTSPAMFRHQHAQGYPSGTYGSQKFHQRESGLDPASIIEAMKGML